MENSDKSTFKDFILGVLSFLFAVLFALGVICYKFHPNFCPSCNYLDTSKSDYCVFCGEEIIPHCDNCGVQCYSSFCSNCGAEQ